MESRSRGEWTGISGGEGEAVIVRDISVGSCPIIFCYHLVAAVLCII